MPGGQEVPREEGTQSGHAPVTPEHGGVGGKAERVADDFAAPFTATPEAGGRPQGGGDATGGAPVPESGRPARTVEVGAGEQRLRPGDELSVRAEQGEGEATHAIEGDEAALEIWERAELVRADGERTALPGASGDTVVTVRARQAGRARIVVRRGDRTLGSVDVVVE